MASELHLVIKQDEDDVEAAQVFVDGTVGGNRYRFLLDTGAARTSIAADDYTSAFSSVEKRESSGVFSKSSEDLITVPSLELGPIQKKDLTVVRSTANSADVRNLIGMDILKDFCCRFLFDEDRVLIDPSCESEPESGLQALFLDRVFHPYVDVQFAEIKAGAVWDTGAGITVVDTGFIQKHSAFFREVGRSTGTDSAGSTMETPMFEMAASTIGGNKFPSHKVAGVDLSGVNSTIEAPMDMILGYSTLSKANWLFDFPRRKWSVLKTLDPR